MVIRETIRDALSITIVFSSATPSTLQQVVVVIRINLLVCFMRHLNYVRQIGYLFFTDSNSQAGRVYDANGLSPTIVCNGGGHKQPKVIVVNETD